MKSDLNISEIKCSKCSIRVSNDAQLLQSTINTCKHRFKTNYQACGIKQIVEMFSRLEAKQRGEPKNPPMVILPDKEEGKKDKFLEIDVDDCIKINIHKNGRTVSEVV